MNQYPKYKPANLDWLTNIPAHWHIKKLKYTSLVQPSNINKKSVAGEQEVLLCNYVDVYKNEFIDASIPFMKATATEDQIEKFALKKGDVLITKDSETPDDIAVPAFVVHEQENLICGYHLAQIRAQKELIGTYLFRLFQSKDFNTNFEKAANGITRYGLGVDSIKDVEIILPPKEEQINIAQYLDKKIFQIQTFISKKQKLIELLKEEKVALINEAVTKGINPKVKFKSSGIDWIDDVPETWNIKRLRFLCKITTGNKNTEDRIDNGKFPFYVRSQTVESINSYAFDGEGILTAGDGVGVGKVFHYVNGKFDFHQRVYLFYKFSSDILSKYLLHYMQCNLMKELMMYNAKSTVDSVRLPTLQDFQVCFPIIDEQEKIVTYIEMSSSKIDYTIKRIEKEIQYMQEYRTALISEVVTGKVCVV